MMADPVAEAMGPLMDSLYARWIEQDVDAGIVDPDIFYERQRDRQAYEERLSWDEAAAADLSHQPEGPPDPQPDDADYLADLADMGIEPHEYEERR